MSYAEAAAKGPKQSPEEARAPNPPQVYKKETSESTSSLVDVDSPHVTSVNSDFLNQEVKTTTQAERLEREAKEEEEKKSLEKVRKEKAKAAAAGRVIKPNPVFVTNAVLYAVLGAGLGYGAYRKQAEGKLSWELIGVWTGAIGAFSAVDYFVSKWFLQNKYPPK